MAEPCACGSAVFCPCGSADHPGWNAQGWGCVECHWSQPYPEETPMCEHGLPEDECSMCQADAALGDWKPDDA